MSAAGAASTSSHVKTKADIRQICIDEIWPVGVKHFEIDDVDSLKGMFLNNRVPIGEKKKKETWACIHRLLGTSGEEGEEWFKDMEKKLKEWDKVIDKEQEEWHKVMEKKLEEWDEVMEKKLFRDGEAPKPFTISRDALSNAAEKLRVECDWPKMKKINNGMRVPKSHLESCNHGRFLRKSLARKMLIVALYDHLHPETPFEWKSEKKYIGVDAETKKKKYKTTHSKAIANMKDVFSKFKPKYVLPSSKCTPACRRMQEKLHTTMYRSSLGIEVFSLKRTEDDISSDQSSSDQSSSDQSSSDQSSSDQSSSDSDVAPNPFPNVTSAFKFRMKRILEIERDERKPPRSKTIQMNGNLFYIKQSNIEGAGLGLFAAESINEGTKLLGNVDTPSMRMRSFGKVMRFGKKNVFHSTPQVVEMNKKAENHYEKHVFEKESQEVIDECWFNTAQQWGKDLSGQEGLSESTKNRMTWIKPTKKTNFGKKQNHPYAIASRKLWVRSTGKKYYIAVKYYDPFNTLWGFLNSSKDDDNVEFVKGKGDNNKSFFYKTELVTKRDIVAGEELLWYYGNAYWSPYKSASEDEFESEHDSQSASEYDNRSASEYDSQSGSYVSTDSEAEVGGLGDEQFYEGYVSSDEELKELQLIEKRYFGPWYVEEEEEEEYMPDSPSSSGDSGSEDAFNLLAVQDHSDKNTSDDKGLVSLQSEVPLPPDLKWGSNVLDNIQAYDAADADNNGEIDLRKDLLRVPDTMKNMQ